MNDATPAPERWLPVVGLEGYYEISDLGPVRSLYRNSMRILRPSYSNTGGYPLYILTVNGVRYPRYGHQMVAEAFIGECPVGQEVRHLDRDVRNAALRDANGIQRLVYGTHGENMLDQVRHGTHYEGSRTHCDADHELTGDNVWIEYDEGGTFRARRCRTCNRDRSAKQREKRKTDERRCKEPDCDGPYLALDWCATHYAQNYKEQPGNREKVAARNAAWYQRRKEEGNPSWVPTADLSPEKLDRRRALARERARRYRERQAAGL